MSILLTLSQQFWKKIVMNYSLSWYVKFPANALNFFLTLKKRLQLHWNSQLTWSGHPSLLDVIVWQTVPGTSLYSINPVSWNFFHLKMFLIASLTSLKLVQAFWWVSICCCWKKAFCFPPPPLHALMFQTL